LLSVIGLYFVLRPEWVDVVGGFFVAVCSAGAPGWSSDMGASRHIYLRAYPFRKLRLQLGRNPRGRSSPIRTTIPAIISMHLADAIFQAITVGDKMPPSVTANLLDDGVGDTLDSRRDERRLKFGYYPQLLRCNCGTSMGSGNRRCKNGSS
jgi:hypothetical protein